MNPCEYTTYDDAKRRGECGAPATHRGAKPPKLFYCDLHAELVRRNFELVNLATGKTLGKPIRWTNKQYRY